MTTNLMELIFDLLPKSNLMKIVKKTSFKFNGRQNYKLKAHLQCQILKKIKATSVIFQSLGRFCQFPWYGGEHESNPTIYLLKLSDISAISRDFNFNPRSFKFGIIDPWGNP